jgi:uncharacterized membrane protein YhaH (DUF805 family)
MRSAAGAEADMDWTYLFTSLEGRINRKPYWIAAIVLMVVGVPLQFLGIVIGGPLLGLIISLVFLFPSYALNLKRGHDRNRPNWMVQAFFALLVLLVVMQIAGLDMQGDQPTTAFLAVGAVFMIASIALFIDFALLRGTRGSNDYGPDPLEGQA